MKLISRNLSIRLWYKQSIIIAQKSYTNNTNYICNLPRYLPSLVSNRRVYGQPKALFFVSKSFSVNIFLCFLFWCFWWYNVVGTKVYTSGLYMIGYGTEKITLILMPRSLCDFWMRKFKSGKIQIFFLKSIFAFFWYLDFKCTILKYFHEYSKLLCTKIPLFK